MSQAVPEAAPEAAAPTERVRPRARVAIANRADGGIFYWIGKLYGFAALVTLSVVALAGAMLYSYFSLRTPPTRDLASRSRTAPMAGCCTGSASCTASPG